MYLDRFCVSFALSFIQEDLGLTTYDTTWIISFFFWSYALGHFGAARAGNFLYLVAPLAMLLAWLIYGEAVSVFTIAGGILVLGQGAHDLDLLLVGDDFRGQGLDAEALAGEGELEGFQRVHVPAGASVDVEFELGPDQLRYWSAATRTWVQDATVVDVFVGGSSACDLATTVEITA